MTIEPTAATPSNESHKPLGILADKQISILEDLFTIGFAKSEDYKLYEDENGLTFTVQFRTLTPGELRDIAETLGAYRSVAAQIWTEKVETLARAIMFINKMPLILDTKDRTELEAKNKGPLTPLDQARIILWDKIKSQYIIDLMYDRYREFTETIAKSFEDIKKKLKNPSP